MRQLVEWSGAVTMNEAYSSAVAVGRSSFGVIYVLVVGGILYVAVGWLGWGRVSFGRGMAQ